MNRFKFNQLGFSIVLPLVVVALLLAGFLIFWSQNRTPKVVQSPKKVGVILFVKHHGPVIDGFKQGMVDLGYKEGENITYLYMEADGSSAKVTEITKTFLKEGVDLIVSDSGTATVTVLKETSSMSSPTPIVFTHAEAPIENGLIKDYKSSGNNATGVALDQASLIGKRFEFLQSINPGLKRVGIFVSHAGITTEVAFKEAQKQAQQLNLTIVEYTIGKDPQASTAKLQQIADSIKPGDIDAIVSIPDQVVNYQDNPKILIELGKKLKVPTSLLVIPNAKAGALMAYNADLVAMGKQTARITDKVLKGAKPSDIPTEFAAKIELAINLKTAKEIGIVIPTALLEIASQKIE